MKANDKRTSIMASVADIPFLGTSFRGCICSLYHNEREYRFATYLGAKVLQYGESRILIAQRNYHLEIRSLSKNINHLFAPVRGKMSRGITENLSCPIKYRLFRDKHLIFEINSSQASYEYVIRNF